MTPKTFLAPAIVAAALLLISWTDVHAVSGSEQLQFVNQAGAMLDAGKESLKGGDLDGAIKQWRSAHVFARSQPQLEHFSMTYQTQAQYLIASALMEARRYDEAIAEAKAGLEILQMHPHASTPAAAQPKNDFGYTLRGTIAICYERSGRYSEALAMLEELSRTYKGDLTGIDNVKTRIAAAMEARRAVGTRMDDVRNEAIKRAKEAEASGDRAAALAIYVAAMQALLPGFDPDLAVETAALVKRTKPLPPIPEEARRHAIYGQTALKSAKESKQYHEAAKELIHALALAPWWPELYLNLALTFELLQNYEGALKLLRAYSTLAPPKEAAKVRDKIYEMEYKTKQMTN